jgi:hypothetical protein
LVIIQSSAKTNTDPRGKNYMILEEITYTSTCIVSEMKEITVGGSMICMGKARNA